MRSATPWNFLNASLLCRTRLRRNARRPRKTDLPFNASQAARWQAYQTRARMGVQLWFQIGRWVLLGWVALTVFLVWHETGRYFPEVDHAYFLYWMLGGVLSRLPIVGPHLLNHS